MNKAHLEPLTTTSQGVAQSPRKGLQGGAPSTNTKQGDRSGNISRGGAGMGAFIGGGAAATQRDVTRRSNPPAPTSLAALAAHNRAAPDACVGWRMQPFGQTGERSPTGNHRPPPGPAAWRSEIAAQSPGSLCAHPGYMYLACGRPVAILMLCHPSSRSGLPLLRP
jgi:hypothetical protein